MTSEGTSNGNVPSGATDAAPVDPRLRGGWVINPGTAVPLTITGIDEGTALPLKALLDREGFGASLEELLAGTGLRCKEIDEYVTQYRGDFEAERELDVLPYCDLESLFTAVELPAGVGVELTRKYGFENLNFYARHSNMIGAPRPIPQTHRDRERFESLVSVGLATIGPPMTRSGKTGEAFTLIVLPGHTDLVGQIGSWARQVRVVAYLITFTYTRSVCEMKSFLRGPDPAVADIIKGYEVSQIEDDCLCPLCKRAGRRKFYRPHERPRLPFHIGCRCSLTQVLK